MAATSSAGDPVRVPEPLLPAARACPASGSAAAVGPAHRGRLVTGIESWLVTRYQEVAAALSDPRLVMSAPRIQQELVDRGALPERFGSLVQRRTRTLLSTDPPEHSQLRRLVNPSFSGRTVDLLRERARQVCGDLVYAMRERSRRGEVVDLVDEFAFPLSVTMICQLLGTPAEDRERFREWSQAIVFDHGDAESVAAYQHAMAAMDEYFGELIAAKRAAPAEDLVSQLVAADDERGGEDPAELRSMLSLLMIAGHETTANLIASGVLELLRNPEQLAALRADPGLLNPTVEECLRHAGPVAFSSMRFTTEEIRFGEVLVPRGEVVSLGLWAADHDPAHFPDPDAFDVHRRGDPHLAFGRGAHFCVGANLARMQAQVALGTLLDSFGEIKLAVPEEELSWRPANTRGPRHLPLRLTE
ncbi:cytochrome P450 [Kutzneria viridogrisea]|uniref:Cytochrome P450 n=1 Tax=Kutzneria viridogrisea TaxID=47990 RepID=A0ABR6BVL4_9PSEU|nr:cytochrome P450 [Kutzneria viridogrisea]